MTAQDPLAALQPLRVPEAIGSWPPAPGWWVAAFLLTTVLCVLAWVLLQRYHRSRYRRLARAQLHSIATHYQTRGDLAATLSELNILLKAVSLRAYPRREVAALSGDAWLDFLNQEMAVSRSTRRFPAVLGRAHAADPGTADIAELVACADCWLRRHRGRR